MTVYDMSYPEFEEFFEYVKNTAKSPIEAERLLVAFGSGLMTDDEVLEALG